MNFEVGQHVKLKKPHPCGANDWEIIRTGADFRIGCSACKHQVMISRKDFEKRFKSFINE